MSKARLKFGIYLISFILLATNAISPAMASLSASFPDASTEAIQLVLQLPQLVSVPFVIFGGAIVQHFSKKRMSLLALAFFAVGGTAGYFANSVAMLLVSRCIYGIGYGLLVPCSLGLASDLFFGTAEYDHVIGMQYSLKSVGSIFYTIIAGMLCEISWQHTFLVYLSAAVVFVVTLFVIPPTPAVASETSKEQGEKEKAPWILVPIMVIAFFYSACISINNGNLSYLIEDNGFGTASTSGIITSLCTVGAAIGAAVYDKVLKLLETKTFAVGILLSGIGMLIGAFAVNVVMVAVCVVILGLGLGLTNPALLMLVGKESKASSAFFFSLVMAAMNLGAMLQSLIVPTLSSAISGGTAVGKPAFLVGGIGNLIALVASVALLMYANRRSKASADGA